MSKDKDAKAEQTEQTTAAAVVTEEPPLIEDLARALGVKTWELAGMMRAVGWAAGKRVDEATFGKALTAFRNRPQGGGKITV